MSRAIQTNKGLNPGEWGRWFVAAATRDDMKTFLRGLQKYTKISNTRITEVKPVNLAWWTFQSIGLYDLLELVKQIYHLNTSYYGNIEELNESYGKIHVTVLSDAGGRDWPILPLQDVSLDHDF
ncbi:hypothetical protein MAC_02803 [Metarhizium acridum CQMa 102]|uniref:Uncharacterized protein n=1 Tax=Metarhizium acridum (strain CQMa 102) TaxID=655827 RepID=E9DYV5_METAQ|nr:uncharacterized protein MAC_02803 [Metarhizium acridum CQMa 102]EFY91132.1 hypothetical protein MAC_02803 [Metarhizium acridum CQMa 102]